MSAHRWQALWRSLVFNEHYDNTGKVDDPAHLIRAKLKSHYRLESLDLTRVEATDYRELRQWLEGAEANEAYEGVLVAIGHGRIIGADAADLEDKTAAFRDAFSIASCRLEAQTADPVGVLPFDFRRDTNFPAARDPSGAVLGYLNQRIYARPASGRPVVIGKMREGLVRPFQFALAAFDPRIYDPTIITVTGATAGLVSTGSPGTLDTPPTITFVCNASGHIKITLNGMLAFEANGIAAGTWTLDGNKGLFTKADGTNGMQYRTAGYLSNLRFLPGGNAIDTTGSANLTSVTIQYRDAYA